MGNCLYPRLADGLIVCSHMAVLGSGGRRVQCCPVLGEYGQVRQAGPAPARLVVVMGACPAGRHTSRGGCWGVLPAIVTERKRNTRGVYCERTERNCSEPMSSGS